MHLAKLFIPSLQQNVFKMTKILLFAISVSIVHSFVFGDYLEQENWVDSGDMISYDPILKQNIKNRNKLQVCAFCNYCNNCIY